MTEEATAISGTRRQYKEMADGTLRVQIDIDPQYKARFLELFGSIDMPVALAPLAADFEQKKEPEKPKGGPLSQSAAQMCDYPTFQAFAVQQMRDKGFAWPVEASKSEVARELILRVCGINSRAELDHNADAAKKFKTLMEEYRQWNFGQGGA